MLVFLEFFFSSKERTIYPHRDLCLRLGLEERISHRRKPVCSGGMFRAKGSQTEKDRGRKRNL